MQKIAAIALIAAPAFFLAACSSDSAPAASTTAKPKATATATDDGAKPVTASESASATPHSTPTKPAESSGPAVKVTHVTANGRDVSLLTMNPSKVSFRYVPGTESPGGYVASKDAPDTYRKKMLAAFNGAFMLQHAEGGYTFRDKTYADLVDGAATMVITPDGQLDVIKWNGQDPSQYRVIRQNLTLLIDNGKDRTDGHNGCDDWGLLGTNPEAHRRCPGERSALGVTKDDGHNGCDDWGLLGTNPEAHRRCPGERSALGVTKDGTVIYAFSYESKAGDLATALTHAGAVRAMELDINNWWPSAYTYSDGTGKRIDPLVRDEPSRYSGKTPNKKDFVVVLPR